MTKRTISLLVASCAIALVAAVPAAAKSSPPRVSTGAASGITPTNAVLAADVLAGSEATSVYAQFGPTKSYGAFSGQVDLPASTHNRAIQIGIGGLAPATTYHYRVVAVSSAGASRGSDRTFTTAKIPLALSTLTVSPNPVAYDGTVTVAGALSGTGNVSQPVVLLARPYPYTGPWTQVGNPLLPLSTGAFLFPSFGVTSSTQYTAVAAGNAKVAPSAVVTESVFPALTARVHRTRRRHVIRFSGHVTPAESGAGISIEKLVRGRYVTVAGTVVRAARYSIKVRIRRRGVYRVLLAATGPLSATTSIPLIVR
jgi:hypothetical protein